MLIQHRNLQLINVGHEFFTSSADVSCVRFSVLTQAEGSGGSLVHLPDNDDQYNQSHGTHQSKNTHPPAGLLLEEKKREKMMSEGLHQTQKVLLIHLVVGRPLELLRPSFHMNFSIFHICLDAI